MGDFFGFNTDIPSNINVIGRHTLEEELLSDGIEDEYDALNDETFGHAANDDWEEAHEKLSELIKHKNLSSTSTFNDSLLEHEDSQNEIVSKSISQLGLEDDLDDPAIMTIARNCHSLSHARSVFGSSSSPPPPAFLDSEECGSPKTHSIWSTTPKDSGITSFLQSIGQRQSNYSHNSPNVFNSSSDNVFTTPPKAWRAEELERDLLSKEPTTQQQSSGNWPSVPNVNMTNQNNLSRSPPKLSNLGQFQNKVTSDRMLTREEVERQMLSDARHFPPNIQNNYGPPPRMMPPRMPQNMMSPIGSPRPSPLNVPSHSSPALPLRPVRGPMLGNNCPLPDPYLFMKAQMSSLMHNRMPLRGPPMPNLPPGFSPSNINLNHSLMNFPPRSIPHPLLNKHFQFPVINHNKYYEDMQNSPHEDEYAGLMTQREKEWITKIQLLLLKTENPYVEDYYFTTQVARRCQKKYSESANKGAGDAPELILPQTSKHENRTYVPTQFEGSLGKLQAVSVNFPRKVLDITVTRNLEDEEGRVVTNQSLLKYRRLLIDIEKMYTNLLEIEDEERRILAKPASDSGPHRLNIDKLTQNIYNSLCNDGCDDNFHHIMTVRKGRSLLMRVFKIFNPEQQLHCLLKLFHCLPLVLKKDQNDHILIQNMDVILDLITKLDNLSYMVKLMEALDKELFSEEHITKIDKSSLATILKYKLGSSVICKILMRAEELYSSLNSVGTDIHTKWSKIVISLVDCLCLLPNTGISPPGISCVNLLGLIQRFDVDNEKYSVLKEKLAILNNECQNGVSNKTV
ncbi:protein PAT1 homolog 1 isoform X2 [Parasteatoda tepidariorum]|nr:protein PAT1 homolog 1 isoform X1 [Parasteatoda tepidariorum]XP_042903344.1 protein PAT1 homolog 1 isoform X2 [Parasteatoda tepidariorum]